MSEQEAIRLMRETPYFMNASEDLLEALAAKMVPCEIPQGEILVMEGTKIDHVLVLEEGTLSRTKLAVVDGNSWEELMEQLQTADAEWVKQHSVTVDTLEGRGRMSGMLHAFESKDEAFATVSALDGPAKVWKISTQDFRNVATQGAFSLFLLNVLAQEVRNGSKSLRGYIERKSGMDQSKRHRSSIGPQTGAFRIMCYDTASWVTEAFKPAIAEFNKQNNLEMIMDFTSDRLSERSAMYAAGYDAVCLFVNDDAGPSVLQILSLMGVQMVALRCAGFDRVDGKSATAYGLTVARVPAYSPYAVAEHSIALLLAVNRNITKANSRIKMNNFTLDQSLLGMDIHGRTIGVLGTGKIGTILCKILSGFGVNLLAFDVFENDQVKELGGTYVTKEEIYKQSDVIFLMMPLLKPTYHTIDDDAVAMMKKGVILVNTSRGGLVDTKAVLKGIRDGTIRGMGIDVYENEEEYFFSDWSSKSIKDQDLLSLISHNNVILTAHQAFFTEEAIKKIVDTTLQNFLDFSEGMTGSSHPNTCFPTKK